MSARLRAPPLSTPFHVVLLEPEIPPNTGNVARLCAATRSKLHLVGKLGFRIDDHAVRRAGLDYWPLVDLLQHEDIDAFLDFYRRAHPEGSIHLYTAHADRSYLKAGAKAGDALIFGKESVGLPRELIARFQDRAVAIPTLGPVRSLNLSNAVSIALYEALRSVGAMDTTSVEA